MMQLILPTCRFSWQFKASFLLNGFPSAQHYQADVHISTSASLVRIALWAMF
jgi:hypothetical protein